MEFKHIYVRFENYHNTKAITIKNEKDDLYTAYPIENFKINEKLWQILLNQLHDLSKDYILHYEFKDIEEEK